MGNTRSKILPLILDQLELLLSMYFNYPQVCLCMCVNAHMIDLCPYMTLITLVQLQNVSLALVQWFGCDNK